MISSSSCPEARTPAAVVWALVLLLLFVGQGAIAEPSPEQDAGTLSQYLTRQWGPADGILGGGIRAIAQTPDGYLWIGTDGGLQRFDGFRFQTMQPPADTIPPIRHVLGLTLDRDGALWIYCEEARLIRYAAGRFEAVTPLEHEAEITSLAPAKDGGVLAVGLVHGLVHLQAGHVDRLPLHTTALLIALSQAQDGRIWVGTREAGILTLKDGNVVPLTLGVPDLKVNTLLPTRDGKVWIGTDSGLALWDGREVLQPRLPAEFQHLQVLALTEDRAHHLWMGTSRGLLRYDGTNVRWAPTHSRNIAVTALFEDHQGDLWVGDGDGLERISDTPLLHYGDASTFPQGRYGPVYVDEQGRTWFAPVSGGLFWMQDGAVHAVTSAGLDHDVVYSIDGRGDCVWVGRQKGGLTQLQLKGSAIQARTLTRKDGLAEDSVFAVRVAHDGSVWAGTLTRGLSHWKDRRFVTMSRTDGLSSNTISAIEEDSQNVLWVGTPDGLSRWDGFSWRSFGAKDGLPTAAISSLSSAPNGVLWIGTRAGLAYAAQETIHHVSLPSLNASIRGVVQDSHGLLWIATRNHFASLRAEALLAGPLRTEQVRLYNGQDGLPSAEGETRSRSLASDPHGGVWLATSDGLVSSTPSLDANVDPTQPHIEGVSTDNGALSITPTVQVPAGSRRVVFHYTGIFLRDPDRVRFRYQLENFDEGWSAPTQDHEAVYTNLAPGFYRFRVMATNGDGTWNPAGSVQAVRVHSLAWQSWTFRLLACGCFLLLGIWIYRARMQYVIAQANLRSEERLTERTAIARDLHDTLLQSFHALILFFQMGVDQIPPQTPARKLLEDALSQSDDVMREGRERLVSLRSTMASPELHRIFNAAGENLRALYPCQFEVIVEGEARAMQTIAQEELAYLGREALSNAFRHADARRIEVRLRYAADSFRMSIADDGKGIPSSVLRDGSAPGHWGLTGMRERARKIGAHFDLDTRPGHGTLIIVRVGAQVIYESHSRDTEAGWLWPWSRRWKRFLRRG